MASSRQKRRPASRGASGESGAGVAVDTYGGPAVDPTENVLALVDAETKFQNGMREASERLTLRLADAESRRIDDLAALRLQYDTQVSENLRIQVKTTSELISTQLDKVTNSLGAQITALTATFSSQIATGITALGDRIADLEKFRWEVGGKTSVSDPALADAMKEMAASILSLKTGEVKSVGKAEGIGAAGALIIGSSFVISAGISIVTFILNHAH